MLADIIAHPWLQGPTATNAEIKQEFQNRLNIVNNRVQEEFLEEKRQARARRGAFEYGNKLYVYGDLTQGELETQKAGNIEVVRPQMGSYVCKFPENNCIYSDVQPETVFDTLVKHFTDKSIPFKLRDDKWKLTFDWTSISD